MHHKVCCPNKDSRRSERTCITALQRYLRRKEYADRRLAGTACGSCQIAVRSPDCPSPHLVSFITKRLHLRSRSINEILSLSEVQRIRLNKTLLWLCEGVRRHKKRGRQHLGSPAPQPQSLLSWICHSSKSRANRRNTTSSVMELKSLAKKSRPSLLAMSRIPSRLCELLSWLFPITADTTLCGGRLSS